MEQEQLMPSAAQQEYLKREQFHKGKVAASCSVGTLCATENY